jgi:ferredoxin
MNITIADGCIACGACESICPEVFTVFESSEVTATAIPGRERACREAAKICPVDVILIEE